MTNLQRELMSLGLGLPDILLPSEGIDLERWAVVACDQFTSEPEYWGGVREFVEQQPSTLDLILPESYLSSPDVQKRIHSVHQTMRQYLADGVFRRYPATAIALVRNTRHVEGREGLLFVVDLDQYDYSAGSRSLIRPTEQTIVDRLPPRVAVRKEAAIELPHILVLIDDADKQVIEPTVESASRGEPLYRTSLMMGGGDVTGYAVSTRTIEERFLPALRKFAAADRLRARYGVSDPPLFVVGDGNHSLAAAKAVWEQTKAAGKGSPDHPARWAMVEVLNLHSPALPIEPIHRVIRKTAPSSFLQFIRSRHTIRETKAQDLRSAEQEIRIEESASIRFGIGSAHGWVVVEIDEPQSGTLAVTTVQELIDSYTAEQPQAVVDYIHGTDPLGRFAKEADSIAVLLPPIARSLLIPTVLERGVLPRKAFSLGEAEEKRYYMEARIIEPAAVVED